MIRRLFRFGLRLGVVAAVVAVVAKIVQSRRPEPAWSPRVSHPPRSPAGNVGAALKGDSPPPAAVAAPETTPEPAAAPPEPASEQSWVEPTGTVCPTTHPIKGKLSSKLYHLPGMIAYERCKPDRCYADEAAARADGLTKAKR